MKPFDTIFSNKKITYSLRQGFGARSRANGTRKHFPLHRSSRVIFPLGKIVSRDFKYFFLQSRKKLMKIIDISWPITENMTEYKDRKTVQLKKIKDVDTDNMFETMITMHSHTGTHIDSPAHFLKNGKTVDQVKLKKLIGPCKVLHLTNVTEKITAQDLEKFDIDVNDVILLKTKNSDLEPTAPFNANFVYLDKTGAEYLASKNIKCVGIDYLGIERNQPEHETHKTLLAKEIFILEGLRLKNVTVTTGIFYCFPLYIKNIDSCPSRVILIEE